jgi:hypothetical protein
MKFSARMLFTTCGLLALTACGNSSVKETLGLSRKPPDEFKVVARPPLSIPPQFNLRPPSHSAESPIIIPADKQAKSIITGTPARGTDNSFDLRSASADTAVMPVESSPIDMGKGKNSISSDSQFMKNIGVDQADPKVREELTKQKIAAQEKKEETSWWSGFTGTREKRETMVDAKAEAKRIQDNKASNKPVTEGKTPEIKDKDRGILTDWFGW